MKGESLSAISISRNTIIDQKNYTGSSNFPIFCIPKLKVGINRMNSIVKGDYFIMDGTLKSIDFFIGTCEPGCLDIYEVIRVQNNTALFWDDHLYRLQNSFAVGQKELWLRQQQIRQKINLLIASNSIEEGNIKIEFRFKANGERHFLAYYIPTHYPTQLEIDQGVTCCLFHAERSQPTAKIYNPKLRGAANQLIHDKAVFETLLVDHNGLITEGSRSNVFFIKQNEIITAPDEMVLSGVIRKKVLEVIKQLNLPFSMRAVSYQELDKLEAAFLTGTSLRILPISDIENMHFNPSHPIILQLIDGLNQLIAKHY